MTQYVIEETLLEKALGELIQHLRHDFPDISDDVIQEKARERFSRALSLAIEYYERYAAPYPKNVESLAEARQFNELCKKLKLPNREVIGILREFIIKRIAADHRAALVQILVVNGGQTRTTADKIIRKHVLADKT
ncbi:MAG: hypothetical protein WAV21_00100 [Minisyncoccia bacterium]